MKFRHLEIQPWTLRVGWDGIIIGVAGVQAVCREGNTNGCIIIITYDYPACHARESDPTGNTGVHISRNKGLA